MIAACDAIRELSYEHQQHAIVARIRQHCS
jgi:hypothetical protein